MCAQISEWLGGWMGIKVTCKKADDVMADNPAPRGDIWGRYEVGRYLGSSLGILCFELDWRKVHISGNMQSHGSCFSILKSPSLGLVSPLPGLPQYLHFSWPSLSSTSESANLCGGQSWHPVRRFQPAPNQAWVQPSLVLISSVSLNKWLNFQVSVCLVCKIELLLAPGEEFMG